MVVVIEEVASYIDCPHAVAQTQLVDMIAWININEWRNTRKIRTATTLSNNINTSIQGELSDTMPLNNAAKTKEGGQTHIKVKIELTITEFWLQ